jgi:hypothetical protein
VFLLLMLHVRKLAFLTRTKLRLLISLNFTYSYTCYTLSDFLLIIISWSIRNCCGSTSSICCCSSDCRFCNVFLIHILCIIFVLCL